MQSRFKQIQKLGLATVYEDYNLEVGHWLRWCFGLPLLNVNEVPAAFMDLMSLTNCYQSDVKFSKLLDYIRENYINETIALFLPTLWASEELVDRTTNVCKSFHSHYKKLFSSTHPHIYLFLEVLKEIQEEVTIKIRCSHIRPKKYSSA